MPIVSIISQPSSGSIAAAYRPVVFSVKATRTDGAAVPPVVFCDIYFDGFFYKTMPKTQPIETLSGDSNWLFDIQDACQEILSKRIGPFGKKSILTAAELIRSVYCKFRSSGYNTDGFLVAEDTAPVQGTGSTAPVNGTGTQSNTFTVVNATLQHHNVQQLAAHLSFYRAAGTWDSNAYPLTHRPSGLCIARGQSDYYPVLSGNDIVCFNLVFKRKGATSWTTINSCVGNGGNSCAPTGITWTATDNNDGTQNIVFTFMPGTNATALTISASSDGGVTFTYSSTGPNTSTRTITLPLGIYYIKFDAVGCIGQTFLANVGINPTAGVLLWNNYSSAYLYRITRFQIDGTNILLQAPLTNGQTAALTIPSISNPHTLGLRVLPNGSGEVLSNLSVIRSGSVVYSFDFVPSLPDPQTPSQWQLQPGDIIKVNEAD